MFNYLKYINENRKAFSISFLVCLTVGYLHKFKVLRIYNLGTPLKIDSHFLVWFFALLGAVIYTLFEYGRTAVKDKR